MAIGILLVEDHAIVRQGVRSLLENCGFEIVQETSDGREAVRLAEEHHPDIAILDLSMPQLNGIDAARQILRVSPRTRSILLTMYKEDHYVLEALRAGVRGYVLKSQVAQDLVQAIREVIEGSVYLSPGISEAVVRGYLTGMEPPGDPLSPREREVLQLVAEGKSTKEIASILGISVRTAESHRGRIMSKLDVHETAGLVRYAIRRGMVHP